MGIRESQAGTGVHGLFPENITGASLTCHGSIHSEKIEIYIS